MGGFSVLQLLQEEGSNTISIANTQSIRMTRPEDALHELFSLHIGSSLNMPHVPSKRAFSAAELAAAREKPPISKVVGVEALKACQDPTCSFEKLAEILVKDPALSGHLLRLGDLASVSRGQKLEASPKL
jgi:hypothetical protein